MTTEPGSALIIQKIKKQKNEIIDEISKRELSENLRQIEIWIKQTTLEFPLCDISFFAFTVNIIHCYFEYQFNDEIEKKIFIEKNLRFVVEKFESLPKEMSEFCKLLINYLNTDNINDKSEIIKFKTQLSSEHKNQFSLIPKLVNSVSLNPFLKKIAENGNKIFRDVYNNFDFPSRVSRKKSNIKDDELIINKSSPEEKKINATACNDLNDSNQQGEFILEIRDEFVTNINEVNGIFERINEKLNDTLIQESYKTQNTENLEIESIPNSFNFLPFANESFEEANLIQCNNKKISEARLKEIFVKLFIQNSNKRNFLYYLKEKFRNPSIRNEIDKLFKDFYYHFEAINFQIDYILNIYCSYSEILRKIVYVNNNFLSFARPSLNFQETDDILTINSTEFLSKLSELEFIYFIFDRHTEMFNYWKEFCKKFNIESISTSIEILKKLKKNSPQYLFSSFSQFLDTTVSAINKKLDFLDSYLFLFMEVLPFNFIDRIKLGFFFKKSIKSLTDDFLAKEIQTKITYEQQIMEFLKKKSWLELLFRYQMVCWFGKYKKNILQQITKYIVSATYEISIIKIKELLESISIKKDTIINIKNAQHILNELIDLIQQLLIFENQWKMENEGKYLIKNYVINELNNNSADSELKKLLLFAFQLKADLNEDLLRVQSEDMQKNINILRNDIKLIKKSCAFFKFSEEEKNNLFELPRLSFS